MRVGGEHITRHALLSWGPGRRPLQACVLMGKASYTRDTPSERLAAPVTLRAIGSGARRGSGRRSRTGRGVRSGEDTGGETMQQLGRLGRRRRRGAVDGGRDGVAMGLVRVTLVRAPALGGREGGDGRAGRYFRVRVRVPVEEGHTWWRGLFFFFFFFWTVVGLLRVYRDGFTGRGASPPVEMEGGIEPLAEGAGIHCVNLTSSLFGECVSESWTSRELG